MNFRSIAFILAAALLIGMAPGGRSGAKRLQAGRTEYQSGKELISVGDSLERKIGPGESFYLFLVLRPEEYLRFEANGWGVGITMAVFGPDGAEIAATPLADENPARLALVSAAGANYTIRISSTATDPEPARFEIRIQDRRRSHPKDQSVVLADLAYLQAVQLQKRWTFESDRQAVEKLEEAHRLSVKAQKPANAARVLCRLGDLHMDRGRPKEALQYYEQSRDISRQNNDERGIAEALARIGLAIALGGDGTQALEILEEALRTSRDTGDTRNEALILDNMGEAYYLTGQQRRALECYRAAAKLWEIVGDRRGLAMTHYYLGSASSDLSEVSDAFAHIEESLRLWRVSGDRHGEALTLTMLGLLYSRTGENQEAIGRYRQAAELFRQGDDPAGEALLMDYFSYTYHSLGNLDAALYHSRQSLLLFTQAHITEGQAAQLRKIGEIHYERGEYSVALEFLEKSHSLYEEVQDERMQAVALCSIGKVQRVMGNASLAIHSLDKALKLGRITDNFVGQSLALNEMGLANRDTGDTQRAVMCFREALVLAQKAQYPFGEVQSRVNLAHALRRLGKQAEALENIEASVAWIESLRTKVDVSALRISYFSTIRDAYDLYIDLLMDRHRRYPGEGRDALALLVSERARARNLLDLLGETSSGIRQSMQSKVSEREKELSRSLNAKALRQMQLMSEKHSPEEADELAQEIRKLNLEYDQLQAEIRIQDPRYAAMTQPAPLTAAEIQNQVLDENTMLLEYSLGQERSYLWAVTRTDLTSYELPSKKVLEKLAREVREFLTTRQRRRPTESMSQFDRRALQADAAFWKSAGELSRILLGPVASKLGACRLVIVADGALQYLPFAALPAPLEQGTGRSSAADPAGTGSVPLIFDHEVVHLPSASTLGILRQQAHGLIPAARSVAILADPVYERDDPRLQTTDAAELRSGTGAPMQSGLPASPGSQAFSRLWSSKQEADGIAALASETGAKWTGIEANRERATSKELANYRIIHFATHAEVNDSDPNLSGIVLSLFDGNGRKQDGFLRLHEIYGLNLTSDLVVLSACSTGLGKDVLGEGLISMVRGFMYAGAARVVASLWKVDDRPTAELMKHFYESMLQDGLTPAAALRAAQVEMLKHEQWCAPYYWAPFVLQGEYR